MNANICMRREKNKNKNEKREERKNIQVGLRRVEQYMREWGGRKG